MQFTVEHIVCPRYPYLCLICKYQLSCAEAVSPKSIEGVPTKWNL